MDYILYGHVQLAVPSTIPKMKQSLAAAAWSIATSVAVRVTSAPTVPPVPPGGTSTTSGVRCECLSRRLGSDSLRLADETCAYFHQFVGVVLCEGSCLQVFRANSGSWYLVASVFLAPSVHELCVPLNSTSPEAQTFGHVTAVLPSPVYRG